MGGETGLITPKRIHDFVPDIASRRVHVCGPLAMMEAVLIMLDKLGGPEDQVFVASFVAPVEVAEDPRVAATLCDSKALSKGSGTTLEIPAGEKLLDYSCREGVCGACRGKLLSGTVAMPRSGALLESELDEGNVLACQARAIRRPNFSSMPERRSET